VSGPAIAITYVRLFSDAAEAQKENRCGGIVEWNGTEIKLTPLLSRAVKTKAMLVTT